MNRPDGSATGPNIPINLIGDIRVRCRKEKAAQAAIWLPAPLGQAGRCFASPGCPGRSQETGLSHGRTSYCSVFFLILCPRPVSDVPSQYGPEAVQREGVDRTAVWPLTLLDTATFSVYRWFFYGLSKTLLLIFSSLLSLPALSAFPSQGGVWS